MRGISGYSFKNDILTSQKRQILDEYIAAFDNSDGASEWVINNRTYLLKLPNTNLFIIGVEKQRREGKETLGIAWGSSSNNIFHVLEYCKMTDIHPYIVDSNTIYYIEDGEVYSFIHKGSKVETPGGKGIVHSIDDLNDICVELENDKNLFYEFSIKEIEKAED